MRIFPLLATHMLLLIALTIFSNIYAQRIEAVYLCQSVREPGTVPVDITKQFDSETPKIHAVVVINGLQKGMILKGSWISVDAIDVPNYEIDSVELQVEESGAGRIHFTLSRPNNGWPVGNYRFDLFVNNEPITSATFSIVAATPSSPKISTPSPPSMNTHPQPKTQTTNAFTGTYTLNSQGVILTLVLQQTPQGIVVGNLTSSTGAQYQLEGELQDGAVVGTCYDQQGGVYFEAHLQGNQLIFTMVEPGTDGTPDYATARQFAFIRGGTAIPTPSPQLMQPGPFPSQSQGMGQSMSGAGIPAPSGQEMYLQGKFCHWSGSSSYATGDYSGYSSTRWAYFDGQGNFTYGSEASYSGSEGMMYGQSPGGETGQYRVSGDQVLLFFSDGSRGVATVHFRQQDGRITELMYDNELYAAQLCD